jgi:hypothetical protein
MTGAPVRRMRTALQRRATPFALKKACVKWTAAPVALRGAPMALTGVPIALRGVPMALTGAPIALTVAPVAWTIASVASTDVVLCEEKVAVVFTRARVPSNDTPFSLTDAAKRGTAQRIDAKGVGVGAAGMFEGFPDGAVAVTVRPLWNVRSSDELWGGNVRPMKVTNSSARASSRCTS